MTRETKVGLVVASTFICLLGVVIASKLRHPEGDAGTPEQEPVAQNITPGTPDPARPEPKSTVEESEPSPAAPAPTPMAEPMAEPAPVPMPTNPDPLERGGLPPVLDPALTKAAPLNSAETAEDKKQKEALARLMQAQQTVAAAEKTTPEPAPVPTPKAEDSDTAKPSPVPLPGPAFPPALPGPVGGVEKKNEADATPRPTDPLTGLPMPDKKKSTETDGGPPVLPPVPPPVANPLTAPDGPMKKNEPATAAPIPASVPSPSAIAPTPVPSPVPKVGGDEPAKTDLKQPTPAPVPDPAKPAIAPPIGAVPGNPLPPITNNPKPQPPPLTSVPPVPAPRRGPTPNPDNLPPLGAPPRDLPILGANATPTPAVAALPQVKTSTEQKHVCTPDDATFARLAKRLYGDEKYARALLEYNRAHPLSKANVLQDPPALRPGDAVYYPSVNLLELSYARYIGQPNAAPAGVVAPVVRISTPMPLNGTGTVRANPPTADPTVSYRVPEGGRLIFDIARQTLGDGHRWPEIYRLNPTLQADQPIPAGTEVRGPATARR
jgi:hypothetical protein